MPETVSPLPLPPDELIDRVVSGFSNDAAEGHRALFLETGQRSLEDVERALAAVGDTLATHERILEFGCGCGRIIRWMEEVGRSRTLIGTDIDARAIEWASANLPFARFDVNEGLPPTRYRDGEFDLIVNHSVFTHLDEHYQDLWLAELQRITSPDGLLVLSIHGEHAFQVSEAHLETDAQRREWRAQLETQGILFIPEDTYVGSAFPDFYHTAFHAPWYVFQHWSRWFDVLAYLPQSSLDFQDQIVLRRREVSGDDVVPIRAPIADRSPAPAAQSAAPAITGLDAPLEMSTDPSRFGPLGLAARRTLFRAARPVLHAQQRVDRSLADAISSLDARIDERMPPLVHIALRQQAERIGRLESDIDELRRTLAGDREQDELSAPTGPKSTMMARLRDIARTRRAGVQPMPAAHAPVPERGPESKWFWEHYDLAAGQILEAFASEGHSLDGANVADVGCGDGFMDLGVLHKARPRRLVGFDLNLTNTDYLKRRAGEEGVDATDLSGLQFEQSMATHIPAEDGAFDFAFSWSAFEHISRPIEVLTEIRRILSADGAFFLQLWPFYFSAQGSHLWEWFPEDHHHLQRAERDVVEELEASDVKPADWTSMMSREFQHLNRLTVDELQRSMLAAGFVVRRVELLTGATTLTPELGRYSWLDLGIGGIKLIATPGSP